MSKEILDAIGVVAYEKGIDPEILFTALEDALLAAYRKTPHAKPFARVEFDPRDGRHPRLHAHAHARGARGPSRRDLSGARAAGRGRAAPARAGRARADDRLGAVRREPDRVADVTTADDFGRIAAQTAKQVDPAAHPRGRARDDVRGVPGPRRRHRHRRRPAGRHPRPCIVDLGAASRRCCPAPSRCPASATSTARASRA